MKKWREHSDIKKSKGRLNILRYARYFLIQNEKWRLKEFQCTYSVNSQGEDAIPPSSYFVGFLNNFIE